jgi:hypothetical protein
MLDLKDIIIESLRRQKELQSNLRTQQLIWANGTDDLEVARLHLEMVSLLAQLMDRYDNLLDKYQQPPHLGTAA